MKTIFDLANHISSNKDDISDKIQLELRNMYSQFMINRIFSCSPDTLFIADLANKLDVNDTTHCLFLNNFVSKRKRYFNYPKTKKENYDKLNMVSKYYNVSLEKANELLELLSNEQIKSIEDSYVFGK